MGKHEHSSSVVSQDKKDQLEWNAIQHEHHVIESKSSDNCSNNIESSQGNCYSNDTNDTNVWDES